MNLSIVIVNFRTENYLKANLTSILQSLEKSNLIYEIIIINNSPDKSSNWDFPKQAKIRLINNPENSGFGQACNLGVSSAKGEYILFLNPDILVMDKSINNLYEFIKLHPRAYAGGQLRNPNKTIQPSCGRFFNLACVFAMLFLKGEKLGLTKFIPNTTSLVDWVSAACLIVRKKDFLCLGGFDENIFLYMEDVDLLYRAKLKGIDCFYYPQAQFIHYGAVTTRNKNAVANTFKGLLYLYGKHYSDLSGVLLKILLMVKSISVIIISFLAGRKDRLKDYYQGLLYTIGRYENRY